jgi:hypothetical protein
MIFQDVTIFGRRWKWGLASIAREESSPNDSAVEIECDGWLDVNTV